MQTTGKRSLDDYSSQDAPMGCRYIIVRLRAYSHTHTRARALNISRRNAQRNRAPIYANMRACMYNAKHNHVVYL